MKIPIHNIVIDKKGREWANLPWIKDGRCYHELIRNDLVCNLGYACESCPYNREEE